MYTNEQILNIYAAAYFNENGFRLTPQSLEKITFHSYTLNYTSSRDTFHIAIWDFDDNDTFDFSTTIHLWNVRSSGWKFGE